jgi:hypothetical protein
MHAEGTLRAFREGRIRSSSGRLYDAVGRTSTAKAHDSSFSIKVSNVRIAIGTIVDADFCQAMDSRTESMPPGDVDASVFDAEMVASLRREIRAGFREAFEPLRQLASDMEETMRKVSLTMARIQERRGPRQ